MGGLTCVFRLEVALRGELGIVFFMSIEVKVICISCHSCDEFWMNCGNLDPTRILRPPFAPVFSPTVRVGPIKPYALGVRDEEAKFSFQFHALLTAFYFLGFLYRCVSISVSREWSLSWLLSLVHSPAHAAEPARPRSHKAPLLTPVACSKGLLRVTA